MNWSACIENSHIWFVPDFYYIVIIFSMLLLLNNCFFCDDSHFLAVKFEFLDICIKLMVYGFLFYFHLFSICFAYNQLMLLAMSILRTLCVWVLMQMLMNNNAKTQPEYEPKISPNIIIQRQTISTSNRIVCLWKSSFQVLCMHHNKKLWRCGSLIASWMRPYIGTKFSQMFQCL